jgi:N4-gp56 family major capsid protein
MAEQYTGTGQVSVNVAADYKQAWFAFLSPDFYYVGYGKRGNDMNLGMNKGTAVQWDRPDLLPVATTPIPEFETPAPLSRFTTSPLTATIDWYGDHLLHSDRMALVALNKSILSKMRDVQTVQYKDTMDQLCRDTLLAGSQVRYANGATRPEVNTVMDAGDLDFVFNKMRRANAPLVTKRVNPSQLVGTVGLDPAYLIFAHIDLEETFKGLTGWVPISQYANPASALPGEIGRYRYGRVICSTNGKIWESGGATGGSNVRQTDASKADVYGVVVMAAEAFGETQLAGKGMEYIVKPATSGGAENPHNQRGSAAWHQATVFTRLQEARLYRIECAAPALT